MTIIAGGSLTVLLWNYTNLTNIDSSWTMFDPQDLTSSPLTPAGAARWNQAHEHRPTKAPGCRPR